MLTSKECINYIMLLLKPVSSLSSMRHLLGRLKIFQLSLRQIVYRFSLYAIFQGRQLFLLEAGNQKSYALVNSPTNKTESI